MAFAKMPARLGCAGQARARQREGRDAALNLRPLPFRSLVRRRGDRRHRFLAPAARFSHRARRIADERLRRLLHLLAELLRLVRNHLRLPRHELTLALREFLWFLGVRQFLAELHRIRQSLVRQRCHLLAGGDSLGLEIFGQLARHAQKAVNGLSALIETLLRELSAPSHSEICRLHRAFPVLLREICCVSCHRLSPFSVFSLCRIGDSCFGATCSNTSCSCNFKKAWDSRGGTRAKGRRTSLMRAIVLSPRDFERCHHTSLLAQSQSGVEVNCSNAMEHSCRIYDSMPVSRVAKRFAPSSARVVAQKSIRLITLNPYASGFGPLAATHGPREN